MAKNLLIVESPAKAKTIEKFLGEDFEVKSSYGHIRDLEKDDMGIDIKKNYAPRYIIPADKQKVVKELKQLRLYISLCFEKIYESALLICLFNIARIRKRKSLSPKVLKLFSY